MWVEGFWLVGWLVGFLYVLLGWDLVAFCLVGLFCFLTVFERKL